MTTHSCIFIVDDEPAIAQAVQFSLEAEGFTTQHFPTGNSCIEALAHTHPALVLLDVGLADGSGFDFFREIRRLSQVPIIYMTARNEEIDRVVGLEMGADDYIVKPFSLRELVARVRVVLRRASNTTSDITSNSDNQTTTPTTGNFKVDSQRKQIWYCNQQLDLTLHEYRLLETLQNSPQQVFTRGQLLQHCWEAPEHRLERTIDSHIKSLRNKLREISPNSNPIHTHRGLGYSLDTEA